MSIRTTIAMLAVPLVSLACDGDEPTDQTATGTIEVSAVTTGDDLDRDGYTVSAAGASQPLAIDGTVSFSEVEVGTYEVEVTGIAANCDVIDSNPRTLTVTGGATAATTFNVECTTVVPTIDGVRAEGEWDHATMVAAFSGATLLYKNDADNLYVAFEMEDGTFTDDDRVEIRFDNARNGTLDADEDQLNVRGDDSFVDAHSSDTFWGIADMQTDGEGAAGTVNGTNFFEMAHPLNSGDAQDFALATGDIVGYCARYFDDGASSSDLTFPTSCVGAGDDLSGYAELAIE